MKKSVLLSTALMFMLVIAKAQTNYLDNYIGNPITLTTIGASTNLVNQPRDLDFKPNSNELWVLNYGSTSGGSNVIFYNAGLSNQTSQYRKDSHTSHFMRLPSAMAFGDNGKWAAVSEIQSTNGGTSTFMGPAYWTSDTSVFARVFQNNWLSGFPLGSHYDMLHQSPFAMGIAHDSASAYWVMDGHNGNICKYDFTGDHGPGYDNHANGKIWRYTDVTVARVVGVPSHMIYDKVNHWLYYIDGVSKTIKRMNTLTGTHNGNLTAPNESLALYWNMTGATVEVLDTLITQPCGMDYYNGRLIVSDYTTGDIYLYNTTGLVTLTGIIVTGHPGMMGVKVGPDGHIWCVNRTESKVYRLDVTVPLTDVSIVNITSPSVENFMPSFFSTAFDICDGNITPAITISNNGTTTVTSVDLQYTIDSGSFPITYTWTGTLNAGSTTSVTLPSSTVVNGSHILNVTILNVNGGIDDIDLNNTFTGSFRTVNPPVSIPFTELFTTTAFPPAGWNYVSYNPNNKLSRVTAGGFGASVGSMKMDNFSGNEDITGQKDYLMSPVLDFTAANSSAYLRFNVAHAKYNTASNDALQVVVSTDCGNTWTSVYNKSGTLLSTTTATTASFTPTAAQWRTDSVSMASYVGQANVIMMFTLTSNFGNNVYIDDIFIGDVSTGIDELAFENSFSVSPNPVSSTITLRSNLDLQNAEVKFINLLGETVLSQIKITNTTLDVSELSNGIYFLQLRVNNKYQTQKFIKQ